MKWNAELYDGKHQFVSEYGLQLLEYVGGERGGKLLDIGCGTGDLAHALKERGWDVTGVDGSGEMIEKARVRFPDIPFVVSDLRSLNLEETFDAGFSNAVLHWIPKGDQPTVLERIRRSLKKGAAFVAEMGGRENVKKIREAMETALIERGFEESANKQVWYFPGEKEYSGLLEAAGFRINFITLIDRPTPLAEKESGLGNWLRMFGKHWLDALSEEEKEEVLKQVERKLEKTLIKDGQWVADYKRLRFKAIAN